MPYKSKGTSQQSSDKKGAPAGDGLAKGTGDLPAIEHDAETQARLEQAALDAPKSNPNRNLDKPELDKPAYGGH
ncbi:hypothetical protein [Hymenobacter arizonensis]|uniref:Uncharacterized protein n=1 Tax=Hymenobacter arizonensis TaxID=1227077 RepID=A0A1I5X3J2_HYMAR|nr:hypothetical protein [Hymenobacter arizonensis]SFQ26582.1 hypothetical protein SAMN04515668_1631 [Hymenobacter arizonensis]